MTARSAEPPSWMIVRFTGKLWRVTSNDGSYQGTFIDRRSAVREAIAEAESAPGTDADLTAEGCRGL